MTEIKRYTVLPPEAKAIRIEVFCREQGFSEEFDAVDARATHLLAYVDGRAVGTCRFFPQNEEETVYVIGRIAVNKSLRGGGIGGALVREAEAQIAALGGRVAHIGAQVQALPFYCKLGYTPVGKRYAEEGVPHQGMDKSLI